MAETTKAKKPAAQAPKQAKPQEIDVPRGKIAVIIIRGIVRSSRFTESTLSMLRLRKKNTCAVYPNTSSIRGMIKTVKDYTTFGELDEATYNLLVEKRGEKDAEGKVKNFFHLSPPRGGFERKGIKHAFDNGGALGNRGKKINDLIKRMI